jgi:hypothetical protein
MAQPHYNQGSFDQNSLDYMLEKLIEQHDIVFKCCSYCIAGPDASMKFSAVMPMGGTAIASSSLPVPYIHSNCNSNNITTITNITSVVNMQLINGNTFMQGMILLKVRNHVSDWI